MTTSQIVILVAIVIYLVGMVVIGALFSKKNKSSDDFYLGGRKNQAGNASFRSGQGRGGRASYS